MSTESDRANVIAPPPLIYLGVLVIGLTVNFFLPVSFLPRNATLVVGIPLIGIGFLLGAFAVITMFRVGTSPDIDQPTKRLVTEGPFQYTRNPIYISFTLIYLGITAAMNALAALVVLPVALGVIHWGVIAREEKYLERKFGGEYLRYKGRVRRWV